MSGTCAIDGRTHEQSQFAQHQEGTTSPQDSYFLFFIILVAAYPKTVLKLASLVITITKQRLPLSSVLHLGARRVNSV